MKKMNKTMMTLAVCAFALAGCQTSITAKKHPEVAHPYYSCTNGVVVGYTVTSGG